MLPVNWIGATLRYDPSNSFAKTERDLETRLPTDVRVTKVPWDARELVRVGGVGFGGVLSKYTQAGGREMPPGVPHLMTQGMAFLLAWKRYREALLTVYDLHALIGSSHVHSALANRVENAMNLRGYRHAKRVIAISEYTKRTLVERCGVPADRIRVAYLGVGPEYRPLKLDKRAVLAKHGVPEGRPAILYVGSEHPRKNVPALLRAMARVKELSRARPVLVKVGGEVFPGGRAATMDVAKTVGVEKDLVFTGTLANEAVAELNNAVDVVAFPSFFEGFGLPVAEAMACGAAVVSSNATSLAEVAGDGALTHDPNDVETLAKHLVDVLENGREDLRARGLAHARKFDWQRFADAHVESYREIARVMGL